MKKGLILPVIICIILVLVSCASLAHPAFSPIPAPSIAPLPPSASVVADASPPPSGAQVIGEWTVVTATGRFYSPEDSIRFFAGCLERNDFLDAAKVFPVDDLPAKLDYIAYSDRLKVFYMPSGYLPSAYRELNKAALIGQAAAAYKSALLCLCGYDPAAVQVQSSPGDTAIFVEAISPARLSGMAVSMVDAVTALSDDRKQKHWADMEAQAKVYGADDCRIYQVVLGLDGCKASASLTMLRYGAHWYIASGIFTPQK